MSLESAKATLISELTSIFEDVSEGNTAAAKASQIATSMENYITAAIATVTIPALTVVTTPGGPASVGILNPDPIPLTGDPDSSTGGLS